MEFKGALDSKVLIPPAWRRRYLIRLAITGCLVTWAIWTAEQWLPGIIESNPEILEYGLVVAVVLGLISPLLPIPAGIPSKESDDTRGKLFWLATLIGVPTFVWSGMMVWLWWNCTYGMAACY